MFRKVFATFSKFSDNLAPNIHEKKRRGARDLRVVKVSAPHDTRSWRSETYQENENRKKILKPTLLAIFARFFKDLEIFGPQQMIPLVILLRDAPAISSERPLVRILQLISVTETRW